MNFRHAIAVFVLTAVSCLAADVDGKWAGAIETPNGRIPVTFDLTSSGKDVTGSTVGPQGEVKITNGKIEGSMISFSLSFDVVGTKMTIKYKGIVAPDHIDFTLTFGDEPTAFVVKRVS